MAEKVVNQMSFKIGGEAGQGVESSGAGFAKALARLPEYQPRTGIVLGADH